VLATNKATMVMNNTHLLSTVYASSSLTCLYVKALAAVYVKSKRGLLIITAVMHSRVLESNEKLDEHSRGLFGERIKESFA